MSKEPSIYRGVRWPKTVIESVERAVQAGAPSFSAVVVKIVLRAIRRGELPNPKPVEQPLDQL